MIVIFLLTVLSLTVPFLILRPFKSSQKLLVLLIIILHLTGISFLHWRQLRTTGHPIVDEGTDPMAYYERTAVFSSWAPFSVTSKAVEDEWAKYEGTRVRYTSGYAWVCAMFWSITSYPALAMRLLKTLVLFSGMGCLLRVWRTDYGGKLAMWGFVFVTVVCTPVFYYNWRNRKDGLLLGLFIFVMALLGTLLRPREHQLRPISNHRIALLWCVLWAVLFMVFTIRSYTAAMVMVAVIMHAILNVQMNIKRRFYLLVLLGFLGLIAFKVGLVSILIVRGGERITTFVMSPRGFLQAFLSPIPWGVLRHTRPFMVPFYSLYWLLLPYVFYTVVRHLRSNLNWLLFVYLMIAYVVAGAIGDPPRKRLIVYPIIVAWVLLHLAYKRGIHSSQTQQRSETEGQEEYCDEEYYEDYEQR